MDTNIITKEQRLEGYRAMKRTKAVTRLAILLAIGLAGFLAGFITQGLIIMNALGI
jgi:hypothetical protein